MRVIVSPPECVTVRALRVEIGDWRAHVVTEIEANVVQTFYYDRMPAGPHMIVALWVLEDGTVEHAKQEVCFIGGDETCQDSQ